MDTSEDSSSTAKMERYIELLAEHDQALTGYVLSMIPSRSDAQDILQETKVALWRSFDSFKPGTNFGAWSRKAALYRILDFRKRRGRENKRLWFTDHCYELLAEEFETEPDRHAELTEHLRTCIDKLTPPHREILILRYFRDSSVEDVASRVDRTVEATYRVLSRIRLALRQCLTQSLS